MPHNMLRKKNAFTVSAGPTLSQPCSVVRHCDLAAQDAESGQMIAQRRVVVLRSSVSGRAPALAALHGVTVPQLHLKLSRQAWEASPPDASEGIAEVAPLLAQMSFSVFSEVRFLCKAGLGCYCRPANNGLGMRQASGPAMAHVPGSRRRLSACVAGLARPNARRSDWFPGDGFAEAVSRLAVLYRRPRRTCRCGSPAVM